jgi:hypothetical protein
MYVTIDDVQSRGRVIIPRTAVENGKKAGTHATLGYLSLLRNQLLMLLYLPCVPYPYEYR